MHDIDFTLTNDVNRCGSFMNVIENMVKQVSI